MANYDPLNTWLSLQPLTGVKLADDSYTLNVHPSGILFDDSSALVTAHKHQITGVKISDGGSLLHLFSTGMLFNDNTAQTTAFPDSWQGLQPVTGVKMSDGSNVLLAYPTGFLNNDGLELNFWTRTLDASRGGSFAGVQVPALFVSGDRPEFGADQHDGLRLTPTGIRFADHSAFQVGDVEGVTVKSTSESGGSKFLREDGDGTCSWQDPDPVTPEGTAVKSTTNGNELVTRFLRADGDGTCSWQNPSLSAAGAYWSSGWVNVDDDLVAIANGATLSFAHGLGSTDVLVQIYVADDSSGTNSSAISDNTANSGASTDDLGAMVTDLSSDSVEIQLGAEGWRKFNATGYFTFHAFASKYIKISVVAGGVDTTSITPEGTSVKSTTNSNETSGKVLTADGDGTSSWQAVTTGDITGVDLTGGTGISIDSETNTTGGAYSSTIICNVEGTELKSTGESSGEKFLREDGDGTCSWQDADPATPEGTAVKSTTNGNEATSKFLRADGDGTCSWQNPSLSEAGAFWSSGWVNEDDSSVAVANGATLTFTHSLGATDVITNVYVNSSASDTNAQNVEFVDKSTTNGCAITSLTSNTLTLQLGLGGYVDMNSSGSGSVVTFASKYIKIMVVAGGVDATSITPEGTSVKSTTDSNEDLGKFLRSDGDGTCSWEFATLNSVMGGSPFRTQYEAGDDTTWVKPEGVTLVHIMAIGAGGGQSGFYGSSGQNTGGGWGGQGGRVSQYVDVSGISSAAITIGTGGNGGSGVNTHGNAGGNTTFGSLLIAGGGARGEYHFWHQTYGGRGKDGRITGSAVSGIHEAIPEVIPQAPLQAAYDGDIGTYGIGGNGGELFWPTSWAPGWDPRIRIYPADGVMHSGGFHCNDDYSGGDPLTATGHYSTQHVTRNGSQCGGPAYHGSQGGPGGPGVLVLTIIG